MADMPDLSHLTEEERKIIEKVMMRQKQEEERENEIMRRKQDEVQVLEETIRQRSEQQKKAGIELDATCHICLKTKFADGVGHMCNYCNIRCCARCGGKVTLRSNKVIWVCILCRKKQELLSKTGQWINKGLGGNHDTIMSKIQADLNQQQFPMTEEGIQQSLNNDKRPKLERTLSAVEKENLPLQRTNSQLRRQYSQQEQSTRVSDQSHYQRYNTYAEEDPRYYRAELDDLMRSAPYYGQTSQDTAYRNDKITSIDYEKRNMYPDVIVRPSDYRTNIDQSRNQSVNNNNNNNKKHKRTGSVKKQLGNSGRHHSQPQRSFSSSDDELRSTPDCTSGEDVDRESEKGEFVSCIALFPIRQ
ncbi:UNVERIFIED_CONTAM: hypothetical protein PYX00_002550 [Menopon gallinae]|uniref:Rab-3-interacting molecule unc-10 n=1 Tax=Menopon gallinae TaxID=328185 RepID=A0AAW2II44_9NEOP